MSTLTHDTPPVARGPAHGVSGWRSRWSRRVTFGLSGALARGLLDTGWSAGRRRRWSGSPRRGRAARSALSALRGRWYLLRAQPGLLVVLRPGRGGRRAVLLLLRGQHMQVGAALLIEYTAPAAVVVWLWLRHGQRPGPVTLVGAALAARGLVLVLDLLSGAELSPPACSGRWARWSACATYFVISADEDNGLPPMALAAGGLLVAAVVAALLGAGRGAADARLDGARGLRRPRGAVVAACARAGPGDRRVLLRRRASPPAGGWARGWRPSSRCCEVLAASAGRGCCSGSCRARSSWSAACSSSPVWSRSSSARGAHRWWSRPAA